MQDFEMFILASGIFSSQRKRALRLYQAGQSVRDTGNDNDHDVHGENQT